MKIQSNAMDRIRQLNTRTLRETVGLQEVLVDPTKEKAAGRAAAAAEDLKRKGIENRKRANDAAEVNRQRLATQTAARAKQPTGQTPRVLSNPAAPPPAPQPVAAKPATPVPAPAAATPPPPPPQELKHDPEELQRKQGVVNNKKPSTSDQLKTGLKAVKTVVKDILAPPGEKIADKKLPGGNASSAEKEIPANNKTSPKLKRFGIGAGLAMMVPAAIELYQNRNNDKEKPADPEPATPPAPAASAPATPPASAPTPPAPTPKRQVRPDNSDGGSPGSVAGKKIGADTPQFKKAETPPPTTAAVTKPTPAPPPPPVAAKPTPPPVAAKPTPTPASDEPKEPKSRDHEYNDKTIPSAADVPLGGTIKGFNANDREKVNAFKAKADREDAEKAQRAKMSRAIYSDESVKSKARSASFVFERIRNITEGRPSQRHPLEGHDYHKKSNDELVYIAKDAHKAAEAMKGHNTKAENKYRDQANDSATVRYYRQKSGMPDWYKKKYGHLKEESVPVPPIPKDPPSKTDKSGIVTQKKLQTGGSAGGSRYPWNNESVQLPEAKEKTEYDYEGDMARGQLQSIISNAQRVHDMLEDNDNLAEWVQSKITLAEDYISTVANYMMSEVDEEVQQDLAEEITADDMAQSAHMQGLKHGREGSGNNMDRAKAQHGENFKHYNAGFLKGRNEKDKRLKVFGQGYNKKRPQPVAEEVEVGDKVSFNHPMTAAPGKTMKKVGTVHKVEDDTVHVKVKSKYGVMTHKKSASELTKEEFNIDEEVEELDELNKDTLYSYSKKAEVDQDKQFTTIGKGMRDNEPKSANKAGHKFSMRSIGINRADKRLQKEEQIEELSSNLLGRYKKSAGEQASAADKSGDYVKGNKRFSGIMKATKKQFANDTKQGVAEGATGAKPGFMLRQDPDLAKKLKDQLARKKKLPQGADFAAQRRKERLASNGRMDEAVESHQEEWIDESGPGLWANIHAKRQRIKQGSKERMRNPGEKGAPESGALEKARGTNEEVKGEYDRKVDKYLKKKYAPDDNKAPPFDAPYAKMPKADKSGAIHSPMSRAKHLAKMAGRKQAGIKENSHDGQDNINTPAKRSLSKTAGMVKTILKGAKSKNKNLDKFESEPELSSQIVKQE